MIVINTVSNERFSLNGIEYFKNFLSFVYGDNVGIYNAYDKTDQRVNLDLYSNFIVNGVVYESAALLQSALLGVIYTRDTLGAVNTVLKGSVKPTDTPTGTGVAFWVATQAGTYTNFGGVVVSANSFAVISRDAAGAFSISQTTFDISSKVNVSDVVNNLTSTSTAKPLSAAQGKALNEKNVQIKTWTAIAFASGDQVTYLGKDWTSNAVTLSTDIPGTSSKWVERLSGYAQKKEFIYRKGSLLYIDKTSTFGFNAPQNNSITPALLDDFLLDFKLYGTPEAGFEYGVGKININEAPGTAYNYSVGIYKYDVSNVSTLIFSLSASTPTDLFEIKEYDVPVYGTLTSVIAAKIVVNWSALQGINPTSQFLTRAYGWKYDKTYLFDNTSNIGKIYEINSKKSQDTLIANNASNINSIVSEKPFYSFFSPNGLSEYDATNTYYRSGIVGYAHTIKKPMFNVNGVQFLLTKYTDTTSNIVKVSIYKGTVSSANINSADKTQIGIYEITISDNSKGLRTVDFGKFVDFNEGEFLYIYCEMKNAIGRLQLELFESSGLNSTRDSSFIYYSSPNYVLSSPNFKLSAYPIFLNDYFSRTSLVVEKVLTIPNKIYAAVGVELNLWNDAIVNGTDRGLASPLEYDIHYNCSKGKVTERSFRFKPIISDVGTYALTIYAFSNKKLIETRVVDLIVVPNTAPTSVKNIVMAGDSLNGSSQITTPTRTLFTSLGNVPLFIGSRGISPNKHESVGGWSFSDFATVGVTRYRLQVSGVTSMAVGYANYSQGSNVYSIDEVNITSGVGNIAISIASGSAPTTSGILTKVSGGGDTTINYTSAVSESANPFWSGTAVDFNFYATKQGISKLDILSIECGINDSDLGASSAGKLLLKTYLDTIYNALISHNASAKLIIQLPTTSGNTKGGAGANYGATKKTDTFSKNVFGIRNYLLATFDENPLYPNVFIGIAGLVCDRYYGYDLIDSPISDRVATTEKVHSNYVHPIASGYSQISDSTYAIMLKLCQ